MDENEYTIEEFREWRRRFKRRRRLLTRIKNMAYAFAITFWLAVIAHAIICDYMR